MIRFCKGPARPGQEFLQVTAHPAATRSVEFNARVRTCGCVLDARSAVLGGREIIEIDANLYDIVPKPWLAGWRLHFQTFAKELLGTSAWMDLVTIVAGRDTKIFDREGRGIPAKEFLGMMFDLESPFAAALRWAAVIGEDAALHLQLQSHPASAPVLNGKPKLRK